MQCQQENEQRIPIGKATTKRISWLRSNQKHWVEWISFKEQERVWWILF